MPRNGSSVYSLPAGNPVVPGTVIATTWANTTLTDIATALTNSLSTDGSTASVSLSGKTMAGGTFNGPAVTGLLTLTGGQIKFPAVAVPSADVNTLDDYEEGTWTPVITFVTPGNVSVVYSLRSGNYTKIGNTVNIHCLLSTSTFTHTTASGNFEITGIPFAPALNAAISLANGDGIVNGGGTYHQMQARVDSSPSPLILLVLFNATTGASGIVTTVNHTSGTNCTFFLDGVFFI